MKKIFSSVLLLMCALCAFTACEDDNDSNPTLIQPTEFILNTPSYIDSEIDLAHSQGVNLSWSQPVYTTDNAPVIADYEIQVSADGTFNTSVEEAEADKTGATKADYATLDDTYTLCKANVSAEQIDKALMQVFKWAEDAVPDVQSAYVRVRASVSGRNPIASNAVKLNFVPYYIELADAPVEMWYLVGACIGDGKWNNSPDAVGTSLCPLSVVEGYEYDKKTGKGVLTFTGYFTTDGFKLIKTPGSWGPQWGSSDGGIVGEMVSEGNPSNICVPQNGYYTLTLDTRNDKLSIEPADITPTVYSGMNIAGTFNGWSDATAMTPMNIVENVAAHNHMWTYVLDASEGAAEAKFLQPGWAPNWGGTAFPYGYGTDGGANIPVSKGVWVVTFNDIDGSYTFTAC